MTVEEMEADALRTRLRIERARALEDAARLVEAIASDLRAAAQRAASPADALAATLEAQCADRCADAIRVMAGSV